MPSTDQLPPLNTKQLAQALGVQSESIRVRLCKTGHYYGLTPTKLPNGRLLWPGDAFKRLTKDGGLQKGA